MLQVLKGFISLFFPEICLCCGEALAEKEEYVCITCLAKLPKTDFHQQADNVLLKAFSSRVPVEAAAAYCYYQKGSMVQKLVHELKYNGRKELASCIGKWYGYDLKLSNLFAQTDVIVPVPLHRRKQRKRGYNQSAWFAKGLSESMGKPYLKDGLKRIKYTDTQTRKSRYDRWENVKDIFDTTDKNALAGRHVLLVDDIITTGATIEACYLALAAIPVASVKVASIGYTYVV